jgi:tetratricopeptide (TPR) repeat protein
VPPATVIGSGVASRNHQFIVYYIEDIDSAITEITQAIPLDANNPYLYAARSLAYQRQGSLELSREDIGTSRELGPDDWVSPLWNLTNDALYFQNDAELALSFINEMIDLKADDWVLYFMRSLAYYLNDNDEGAFDDANRSIELDADANFPYLIAGLVSLKRGDFVEMQDYFRTVREKFPDPTFSTRIISVILSDEAIGNPIFALNSAAANMLLGQWRATLNDLAVAIEKHPDFADYYLVQGFTYCNLGEYELAEESYTNGLELEPELPIWYLLRAEVRRLQGGAKLLGATQDIAFVQQNDPDEVYTPIIGLSLSGEFGCQNLFEADFHELLAADSAS